MKTAPLHFKINCLAIEQQELINDGNKLVMEIYVLVTQNRAVGMLKWGGEIKNTNKVTLSKREFLPNCCRAPQQASSSGRPQVGVALVPRHGDWKCFLISEAAVSGCLSALCPLHTDG